MRKTGSTLLDVSFRYHICLVGFRFPVHTWNAVEIENGEFAWSAAKVKEQQSDRSDSGQLHVLLWGVRTLIISHQEIRAWSFRGVAFLWFTSFCTQVNPGVSRLPFWGRDRHLPLGSTIIEQQLPFLSPLFFFLHFFVCMNLACYDRPFALRIALCTNKN